MAADEVNYDVAILDFFFMRLDKTARRFKKLRDAGHTVRYLLTACRLDQTTLSAFCSRWVVEKWT